MSHRDIVVLRHIYLRRIYFKRQHKSKAKRGGHIGH